MDDTLSPLETSCEPEVYEIRFKGYLHERRKDLFEGLRMTREIDGTSILLGPLPDQTALHSILLRIRNMNLKLISVRQVEMTTEGDHDRIGNRKEVNLENTNE
jgi:hypothetical protein